MNHFTFRHSRSRAFTLIELLVVVGIIVLLIGITIPSIKAMSKSNDRSQAGNLIRSMVSTARSIAMAQHRLAGVVLFEETSKYASPVHGGQTALQLIVEDPSTPLQFIPYSDERVYLPADIQVATLTADASQYAALADNTTSTNYLVRVILFDASGKLAFRKNPTTIDPATGGKPAGQYPMTMGDWKFDVTNVGTPTNNSSAPGFLIFNRNEYRDAGGTTTMTPAQRATWLYDPTKPYDRHADLVMVNAQTGTVIQYGGTAP